MVSYIYRKCFSVLGNKPIRLWGLSLLASFLSGLAVTFGVLPIISVPITLAISAGMALVYLEGYRGKEVDSTQIFMGFKNFGRVAGGMAWWALWTLIWSCIPVYGIIKSYSYRFTPYILMTDPEISANGALKKSMQETYGLKGKMFLADLLLGVAVGILGAIAGLFYLIPYIGIVLGAILMILVFIVLPLFNGLLNAAFYEERASVPQPQKAAFFCSNCGSAVANSAQFCPNCGFSMGVPQPQGYPQQGYQAPPMQQPQGYPQQGYQAPVQQQAYQPPQGYQAPPVQPQQEYQATSGEYNTPAQ